MPEPANEPATEHKSQVRGGQWPGECVVVGGQQLGLAAAEGRGVVAGQFALHSNELRPGRLAVLVQPVGVDQARGIISGSSADGGEQGGGVGHGYWGRASRIDAISTARDSVSTR